MKKNIKIILILLISVFQLKSQAQVPFPNKLPKSKMGNEKTRQIKTRRGSEHKKKVLKKVINQKRIQNAEKQEWRFENEVRRSYGIGAFAGLMSEKARDSGTTSRGSFGVFGEGRFLESYRWNASVGTSLFPVWETRSYGFELGVAYSLFQLELVRIFQESGRNLFGPRVAISLPLGSQYMTSGVSWIVEAGVGALNVRNPSTNQNSTLLPIHLGAEGEFGTLIAGLNWRLGFRVFHIPDPVDFPEWGAQLRVSLFRPL